MKLTPIQVEILQQVADGTKVCWTRTHSRNPGAQMFIVRRKLGARHTAHAVAIGIRTGLIK